MHIQPEEDFSDYSMRVYQDLLEKIEGFTHKHFSLEVLAKKIDALLAYNGEHAEVAHTAVFNAMGGILHSIPLGSKGVGRIFGLSGEISGLYEIIIKRGTTLEKIELGRLEAVNKVICGDSTGLVKEFDAVSSNSVYEFKFHLTLHKLYQQVIGVGSAKTPHFKVLTDHPGYAHIRNLVYFGEHEYGNVTGAISAFIRGHPSYASRVLLTDNGGIRVKFSLEEMKDFLFAPSTIALVRHEERFQRCRPLPHNFEFHHRYTEQVIDDKLRQLNGDRFDIIIAVSNVPEPNLHEIRPLLSVH